MELKIFQMKKAKLRPKKMAVGKGTSIYKDQEG